MHASQAALSAGIPATAEARATEPSTGPMNRRIRTNNCIIYIIALSYQSNLIWRIKAWKDAASVKAKPQFFPESYIIDQTAQIDKANGSGLRRN